jgi:hypothetical protein
MTQVSTHTYLRVSGVFGDVELAENFLQEMKKMDWWDYTNGQGIFRKGRLVGIICINANNRDLFQQFLIAANATIR